MEGCFFMNGYVDDLVEFVCMQVGDVVGRRRGW